ncbi:hypothetical protein RJD38_22080 (plasmid) [Vibrio scophthalmi]|uniref:hypothetical protein n=1 Tax=Vibrio scophthalmi TaxID=45658 RepID=UPI00349F2085
MDKVAIIEEAIRTTQLTSEELNSLNRLINHKIEKIEQSEKVRIFSLSHCDTTQYYMTPDEVKAELINEIQSCEGDDIVGVDFRVRERHVSEHDLSEYIGKLFI